MVCDVLTQSELTIGKESGEYLNVVEVVYENLSLGLELVTIALGPPVREVSILIELTAFYILSPISPYTASTLLSYR